MRRFTLWCFLCCLTVTMNAQNLTPMEESRISESPNGYLQELLTRWSDVGTQSSSPASFFTQSEIQALRTHFNSQGPENAVLAACDFATEITSGDITNQPLFCGTQDLLNGTTVDPFCDDANGGGEIPDYYGGGLEATYTYTPGSNGTVTLTVDNTSWAAIFVYDGCPTAGGTCVTATRATGDTRTVTFEAVAETEYFIWIDTWPAPASPCVEGGQMTFSGPEPSTGGGGTFPEPYCGPVLFDDGVEPITLVDVAGISNVTDATLDGSPAHEDFTAIEGEMEQGVSYAIALEGNTAGNWTVSFTVFIDWNQDEILDNATERFEVGTIVNSTGTDGQQATNTIVVPADAVVGPTRMRVIKKFSGTYATDSCTPGGLGFGQAEDYTINITAGGGGGSVVTAYGINNDTAELIGFDITDPTTVTVFGDSGVTVNFENAGAIDPANPTTGYVLDNGGQFYSFDVVTGFYTLLGNIPGDWVGMEFDQSTGILYAVAGTNLYTIDVAGITSTLVGSMGLASGDLPIALAIDGAGNAYTYELVSDVLYSVDLATGTATLVGPIGFNANFGQGMAYDPNTDTIYMAAFNNGTFAAEWRSVNTATGATTLIDPIAAGQVGWVSIGETLPPPACPEPTNLVVSNVTVNGADLSWSAEPNASNGYEWFVFAEGANPTTDTPVESGLTAPGVTTASAVALTGSTAYDFYVVADCDLDGLSTYAGPINFMTPPGCGDNFYDTGGPAGNYENNANVTTTISPDVAGDVVTVTFTSFDTESGWDALYVYDGPDATYPLLDSGNPATNGGFPAGGYYGTTIPGPFTATDASGALTFVFLSDGSVPKAGWVSMVTCGLPPACPAPTNLTVTGITETSAILSWDIQPNATNGYEWFVFLTGDDPVTDTPVTSGLVPAGTTTANATGLEGATTYDFYVVADCDADGLSTLAGPETFETLIPVPVCGGNFYDTGGPAGNYENNANVTTTIMPDVSGDMVTVTFTSFDVETGWDALYVYDGPDATSPIISSGNPPTNSGFPAGGYYGTTNPGPFTSTHSTGALTFVFRSEGSVTKAGWVADVTCATPPPPNDEIVNSIDVDQIGFPYTDPAVAMQAATTEDGNPDGCDITGANGVWYNFVPQGDGTATATIITPAGASSVTFYTAPDEDAIETDLALVVQNSNQCAPGNTAMINTVAGQAYYVFVLNTGGSTDIVIDGTNLGVGDNSIEGFSYYPNPTREVINLQSVENIETVAIYNVLGQKVMGLNVNATTSQINVSELSTGTYIMKVSVNGQIGTYKVLKK